MVIPDLIAGNVDFLIEGLASLAPHARSGALPGLAVTGEARSAPLPAVPTAMEAGLTDFRILNWFASFALAASPAASPAPALAQLSAGFQAAVKSPAVTARLAASGIDAVGSSPVELGRFWDAEFRLWTPVVQAAGVALD